MNLILFPHPTLRHKSKPVRRINKDLRRIVAEMFAEMYKHEGLGLAANQVDLPLQIFVMNTSGKAENTQDEFVLINPVIHRRKGNEEDEEGCLSFPDIHTKVIRSATIEIEAVSLAGTPQVFHWNKLLARAAQHECDHLVGMNFIDRLSSTALTDISDDLQLLSLSFIRAQDRGEIPSDAEIQKRLLSIEQQFC